MNIVAFFFDFFLTISNFFDFWRVQGGPGASGGASWGFLGGPGKLLGAFWEGLGRSWGGPGESGERLGRLLGGLGAVLEAILQQDDF